MGNKFSRLDIRKSSLKEQDLSGTRERINARYGGTPDV